jgi:pimeloyl-ACP methyl ester carboxylesterase
MRWVVLAFAVGIASCGHAPAPSTDEPSELGPFIDAKGFKPRSFGVEVTGQGRPIIFIPGLGCPGEMWADTVAHLGDGVQAHVLTLSGFAGRPRIPGAPSANVRKELVRYIRSHRLKSPIIVGHSMGGFIAYWIAVTAPDLIGGVIVVDAGPALTDNDVDTANTLRNMWAQAGDDELPEQVRAAYSSMTNNPKKLAPIMEAVARSDRQTIGDAIYELVRTNLTDQMNKIRAPLLLVLADGGYQQRYRAQVEAVPDHEVVVIPKTRHFVMVDDPDAFYAAIDKFLAAHE